MSSETETIPSIGSGEPRIEIRKLSKWYGDVLGLNDISLKIGEGVFGLLGPNGAGKSTLMKLITGQLEPSRGDVRIEGKNIRHYPEQYASLGYVPQGEVLYDRITGHSFLEYLGRLSGLSRQDAIERADEALREVKLYEQRDRNIGSYSKGMRQRLKLGQAMLHDPRILILDEPLTGTDPVGRRLLIDKIHQLGDEAKTVLVSSHVLHEVEQMTDNILLINNGRLLADGNIHDIRDLIDEHPHSILLDTNKPRAFGALLFEQEDVSSIDYRDGRLLLTTKEPTTTYDRICSIAVDRGFIINRMTSPDDNLDSLFEYLVEND
jgi:ABC-2 type transport system ATP-binding protein